MPLVVLQGDWTTLMPICVAPVIQASSEQSNLTLDMSALHCKWRLEARSFTTVEQREQVTENMPTDQRSVRSRLSSQFLDANWSISMLVEFLKYLKIYGKSGGGKASRL